MKNTPCPGRNQIHCQNCSLSELCIPFSLNNQELDSLDDIINRKRPIHKGDKVFNDGEKLHSLYAIRSGTFKTFTIDENGEEQITGFHLPGDVLGFDAIIENSHPSFAQAMETSMVCEIPYENLDQLTNTMPKLRKQILRMMSGEIKNDQQMLMLLNHKNAEQRLANFILSLSERFSNRGLSATEFRLTMTRSEIGNYIGLTVETISRLLNRFQKSELISVSGKLITIHDIDKLTDVAEG
jgi:CRP/FNR family transcriptional regulator